MLQRFGTRLTSGHALGPTEDEMKALTKLLAGLGTAVVLASAAPAAAQYYDYRYDRDRDVVDEVVEGVARVAGAVAQVTRGGYYDPRYGSSYDPRDGQGYGNGGDRYAADRCAYEAQRRYARRYGGGGGDIRDVHWSARALTGKTGWAEAR